MRLINVIMLVSVIGITVGVAALVIVMSVFNGFNSVVTSVLIGFDPHIRVEPSRGKDFETDDSLEQVLEKEGRIKAWAPFVQNKAILVSANINRVVYVKGVLDSLVGRVSGVSDRLVLGNMSFTDSLKRDGIVLGLNLADRLAATVGSEVLIISPVGIDALALNVGQPFMKKCRVTGIFDSNNKDYDANYAFVSLPLARRLFDFGATVSGIEIRLHSIDDAEDVSVSLQDALGPRYRVSTWYDLHKDLYAVMTIERWSAYIILCLITGVAMFNVLGSLTMSVVTKRREVGVLKSIGSTTSSILRIFVHEGLLVGMIGTVIGMVTGLAVCYLQVQYHLFPLDPSVYIIPAIPVEVRWTDVALIVLTSIAFSAAAASYPAFRAARLRAAEAIRWE
jgi:lipoprotein-releasing system permease protein